MAEQPRRHEATVRTTRDADARAIGVRFRKRTIEESEHIGGIDAAPIAGDRVRIFVTGVRNSCARSAENSDSR